MRVLPAPWSIPENTAILEKAFNEARMLKPGETVVAATNYRDYVLVFGSYGTVLRIDHDHIDGTIRVMILMNLERGG